MELLWTPEAVRDREGIFDYIEEDNPLAALALDELMAEKQLYSRTSREWDGLGESRAPLNWSFIAAI